MARQRFIGLALSHAYAYNRDILRGIARQAETRPHWRFVLLKPEPEHLTRQDVESLDAAVVDIHNREWCDIALQLGVRLVSVSDVIPDLPIARIGADNTLVGRMAAEHFLERGLCSFGYVGQRHYLFSREREVALRAEFEAAGHPLAVYNFEESEYDVAPMTAVGAVASDLADWFDSLTRPAGVLTPCDIWAVEIIQVCRKIGLRVPEDIAVLGVDDDDLCCSVARPSLSSIVLPTNGIAPPCRRAD